MTMGINNSDKICHIKHANKRILPLFHLGRICQSSPKTPCPVLLQVLDSRWFSLKTNMTAMIKTIY